jgi:pimeloyl-ACP methyl ester carboxylesterase
MGAAVAGTWGMESFLTESTILVFLHGVGAGDPENRWISQLSRTLVDIGYPDLNSVDIITPKFAHALKGFDGTESLPGVTIKNPPRDEARQNRRDFERRAGAIEFRLGRHDRGDGYPGADAVIDAALANPKFSQARNYLHDPQIRAQVLNRILASLPEQGRIVIVAHSLGSVIAADLLRRLPVNVEVAGMVTIGSPLASERFVVDKLRENLKEPPTNLAWWVNFWNANDPVSARRGASSAFPWLVDFRLDSGNTPIDAHDAIVYLAQDSVAEAVGFGLFGSRSKDVALREQGVDLPLDPAEDYTLAALRYAHLIGRNLKGDVRDRFEGAVRRVQSGAVDGIINRNRASGRGTPSQIARLAFDFSDPDVAVPEPNPSSHRSRADAVVLFTVLASENVIRPFEISLPKEVRPGALEDLAAESGLGSQYGKDTQTALKRAQEVLSGGRGVNWIRWGAVGAGAAAIVVATGGLALAAGAGLAGAAAITSALAAFGPGGMIGGLLTAGTLVTAGGSGIAYGLASTDTPAEALESVVVRQLAAVILRDLQSLEQDPAVWRSLVETEMEIRRQYERLDEFSDDSAHSIKELRRKIEAVERALEYMSENGLAPDVVHDGEEG